MSAFVLVSIVRLSSVPVLILIFILLTRDRIGTDVKLLNGMLIILIESIDLHISVSFSVSVATRVSTISFPFFRHQECKLITVSNVDISSRSLC